MKKKKNLLMVGKLLLVFILFRYSYYFQYIPIYIFNIRKITPELNVLLNTFSNIILLIILFLIYRLDLRGEWKKFTTNLNSSLDSSIKYWAFGLAGMMISNILIGFLLNLGQAENEQIVQNMLTTLPLVMLLNAGFIAPIIEELVFRKAFRDAIKNKWLFIVTSGLVFGLMHVISSSNLIELIYIIPYGILGIAFAYIYDINDSVFPSIMVHMLHNTILILMSIL